MVASLYELTLKVASDSCEKIQKGLLSLSGPTLCDLLCEVAHQGKIHNVQKDILDLDNFIILLVGAGQSINKLRFVFKVLVQEFYTKLEGADITFDDLGTRCGQPAQVLASAFLQRCRKLDMQDQQQRDTLLRNGDLLGSFLYDAGWYYESANVFRQTLYLAMANNDAEALVISLSCCEKLLSAQCHFYMYKEGKETYLTAQVILKKLQDHHLSLNLASLYTAFSAFEYMSCSFNNAIRWSVMALQQLQMQSERNVYTEIDVLRRASLCCAVKREADKGRPLIMEALHLAKNNFGAKSVKYADTLLDLGDFMLKTDSAAAAVKAYQTGLECREIAFGKYNLNTAVAYEDLAYALYVFEYSSGNFAPARHNADSSIEIMSMILPPKHMQLASSKRVVALIQEEVAIESVGTDLEPMFLNKAEEFHLSALKLSIEVFGEMCVHTAKHYGNLGRLYQTMKKYDEAEVMHLKSIAIKEELLGKWDYEVSLSVGHLASLYNYDMGLYDKAEPLHIRSIEIGEKLFGQAYSGLEYEYRGLVKIYSREGNREKAARYIRKLNEWKFLREIRARRNLERDAKYDSCRPLHEVLDEFFDLQWLHTEVTPSEVRDVLSKSNDLDIAVE